MRYLMFLAILSVSQLSYAEEYASAAIGHVKLRCTSDSGTEIKKSGTATAPSGYFFTDVSVVEVTPTVSYAGGQIGCTELSRETAQIPATVGKKKLTVTVPVAIHFFAHADCGSGKEPVLSGKEITAHCQVRGNVEPIN